MNKKVSKRSVDLVVVSDIHLGTYGCKAEELLRYLKSIQPKTLILNGDIIDFWQFNKNYFPKSHMKVLKYFTSLLSHGVQVYYVTGNHDETLRKFVGFEIGSLKIVNKVVLPLNGQKAWFFHGDVFDFTMKHSKWLAKLGAIGYDTLIHLNNLTNWMLTKLQREKYSFSKVIKNKVKGAVSFINNFEETAAEIALTNGYNYVVCGHIHEPKIREFAQNDRKCTYLNSGDWVESLTALEYHQSQWRIYHYTEDSSLATQKVEKESPELAMVDLEHDQLFNQFFNEIGQI